MMWKLFSKLPNSTADPMLGLNSVSRCRLDNEFISKAGLLAICAIPRVVTSVLSV